MACRRDYLAEFAVPNLVGRFPVQDLHGSVVDLFDDGLQVRIRQAVEAGPLGQVTADALVAVLVRPSLVRGVRVREIGEHAQRLVHERVAGGLRAVVSSSFDLQPPLNSLGRPSPPERVHDPGEWRRVRHTRGPARPAGPLFGLPPRGHGRMERPRRPRVRLRAARPSGTIRVVLVGRGPQAAFQLATDGRLVTADPWGYLTHAKLLPVPQFVDPDTFLCRQVGIRFHIERDTFSGHEPEHFQP